MGGIYGWIDHDGTSTEHDSSGLSPIVGIGAELDLSDQLSVRAEFEYVNDIGQGNISEESEGSLDAGDRGTIHPPRPVFLERLQALQSFRSWGDRATYR